MDLQDSAIIAVKEVMGVKDNEVVLIICDEKSREIGYTLHEASKYAKESILIEIIERESNGQEPPEIIAEALLHCDVALIPTTKSMSHTQARGKASNKGTRIATLPGITEDIMKRTLDVDYKELKKTSEKLADLLSNAEKVRIKTERGTDLKCSIKNRKGNPDIGICHSPGDFTNLPAGEAFIAPVEGTAEGLLIIDGSLAGYGKIKNELKISIKNGFITELSGDGSDFLKTVKNKYGKNSWNVAELGIGTNPKAIITGNVLEDEKVLGTLHIAFGDNSTFGGVVSVDSHLDGVFTEPVLFLDDSKIMEKGKLLIQKLL